MNDIFKVRRRIAIASFLHVIGILYGCGWIVVEGTTQMQANLQAASPIIMAIVAALIGNVSHYMHLVHAIDKIGASDG